MPAELSAVCALLMVVLLPHSAAPQAVSDAADPILSAGNATLTIHFAEYRNTQGKLSDGTFCDVDFQGAKISDCDPIFQFEIMRENSDGDKLYVYKQENSYTDAQKVKFGAQIGTMKNPLQVNVRINVPGRIFLKARVEDYDRKGTNKLMDIFVFVIEKIQTATPVTLVSKITSNRLKFTYHFVCAEHFFGPQCAKRCKPQDDDANGHYGCSPDGDFVCLPGWANVDENCRIPDWCRWC